MDKPDKNVFKEAARMHKISMNSTTKFNGDKYRKIFQGSISPIELAPI